MKSFWKRLIYFKSFLSLFGRIQCCPNKRIYVGALSRELFLGYNETCKTNTKNEWLDLHKTILIL